MLIVCVSPWHVLFSRMAHEGMAPPGLFCVAIVLSLRHAALGAWACSGRVVPWILAGMIIGVSTNAYGATRLTGLLFAVLAAVQLAVIGLWGRLAPRRVVLIFLLLVPSVLAGASPQVYAVLTDAEGFLARSAVLRFHAHGWYDAVATFLVNVSANLDPRYLFLRMDTEDEVSLVRCSVAALPFFYAGALALLWPRTRWTWVDRSLLLAGVLICISPAAVTRTNPHALRASGCAVLFPMISALGVVQAGRCVSGVIGVRLCSWERCRQLTRIGGFVMGVIFLATGVCYVVRYVRSEEFQRYQQQPEWVALGRWLGKWTDSFDRVYVAPTGNGWDLYVAAFGGMRPSEFQSADREVWGRYNEYCVRLNRYYFADRKAALRAWQDSRRDEQWLIVDSWSTRVTELSPAGTREGRRLESGIRTRQGHSIRD